MVSRVKRNFVVIIGDNEYPYESHVIADDRRDFEALMRRITEDAVRDAKLTSPYGEQQTIKVRVCELTIVKGKLDRSHGKTYTVTLPFARITDEQYAAEQAKLLDGIPQELHGPLCSYAYERGHSAGMEECINELNGLVEMIRKPLQQYTKRLTGG